MERRFLLVDASVLPDVFIKVLKAKELLASGAVRNISSAVSTSGSFRHTLPKSEASFIASIISRLFDEEQPSVPKPTRTPCRRISLNGKR